jgi:hypothetical protein
MVKIAAAGAMLAAATGIPAVNAQQDGAVRAGVLTCEVSGGTGFIFGSSKSLSCVFESDGGTDHYVGEINKFGIDIGVTGPATLSWAVLAPSSNLGEGVLAGSYVGASAEASAGVGAGANLLVGGSNDTISLQPLSVQGQTGVNAALAVSELVLDPA